MKKAAAFSAVLVVAAGIAQATPNYTITVNDPFANGDSCAALSCDVVANGDADRPLFDIQKGVLTVSGSTLTMQLFFDFGANNTNLNPFVDSLNLSVGDLFFTVNGNLDYVAPLASHNGSLNGGPTGNTITAGDLYSINNASGVLTAQQTLNDPTTDGLIYRRSNVVYGFDNGAGSLSLLTAGTESIAGGGDGIINPKFDVTLTFNDASIAALAAAANNGSLGFYFASATCANDVISSGAGSLAATPEPASFGLAGIGLLSALVWGRRKKA